MSMKTEDTLLAYSEWLDGQGIVKSEEDSGDKRDHGSLVADFVEEWEANPDTATLAGREHERVMSEIRKIRLQLPDSEEADDEMEYHHPSFHGVGGVITCEWCDPSLMPEPVLEWEIRSPDRVRDRVTEALWGPATDDDLDYHPVEIRLTTPGTYTIHIER